MSRPIRASNRWRSIAYKVGVTDRCHQSCTGRWIGGQYFIGQFNGTKFTAENNEEIPGGVVFVDFERNDHGNRVVTGETFVGGQTRGTLPHHQPVVGYLGERVINSYHGGDCPQGTMHSPKFTIEHNYINFLIGEGNHPGEVGMDLLVDGESVRSATGANSEQRDWKAWEVSEFDGETAQLKIFDYITGGSYPC